MSRLGGRVPWSQPRLLALVSVALALGAPLRTMYHLIDVVGSPTRFLVVAAVALVAGATLARVLHPALALAIGAVLFVAGIGWYVTNITMSPPIGVLVEDTFALVMGRRLLQIADVQLWVVSYVSAPVFLTTYFAVRRWYVTAVGVAGVTLAFFVLTTDAGVVTTLLGVVGGVAAIGFGRLEGVDGRGSEDGARTMVRADVDAGRRSVLELLGAIVVVPAVLSQVPGVRGTALSIFRGGGQTIESSLVNAGDSLSIQGAISLTPDVRYTVQSDEGHYWRAGCYDRYTGDGWVRTGEPQPYGGGPLPDPPGGTQRLSQSFEAQSDIGTLPAAWKPISYDGDTDIERTRHDGLVPAATVEDGDTYDIESLVLVDDPDRFRAAGDDYPDFVEETYLQLPESTPERVTETTERLTENAQNPYDTAAVIERWLQENREYSLDVSRPRRNVADRFLHAMDRGYCVYFATTMVVMLRTQDVPARLAVGYTEGERDGGEWVVRGLHSHAWVEVYIPDNGWVEFDPTPAGPREAAERQRLEAEQSETGSESDGGGTETPRATETPTPNGRPKATEAATATTEVDRATPQATPTAPSGAAGSQDGFELPRLPSREAAALGLVALVGTVAGLRQSGVTERVSRAVWLRYQRPDDPATDVERAFQRAMYVLGKRHRQRADGETVREYLDAVGASEDVRRLATLRERLRYDGVVSETAATEAIEIADAVVSEQ